MKNSVFDQIKQAKTPEALFGTDFTLIKKSYRKLAAQVHPDKVSGKLQAEAVAAFTRLTILFQEAEKRHGLGLYGTSSSTPTEKPRVSPTIIKFGGKQYTATSVLGSGDICDVFDAGTVVLKVTRNPKDNDLLVNEASALKILASTNPTKDRAYVAQLPSLVNSFQIDSKGAKRQVNVLTKLDQYYSLQQIIDLHPEGIDYRDAVWMIRRALMILGYVHNRKIVHGAVTPEHFLVHPQDHGGMLIDWCYSSRGKPVVAIAPKFLDYYPSEVLGKLIPEPATDLYMLAKCAVKLLGGDPKRNHIPEKVPRAFAGLLRACLFLGPAYRNRDAFELHDQFGEVMKGLVGKPVFRPFHI